MLNESNPIPDTYLGDGVYASFDGFVVTLDLRAQDSTTRIYLEPYVIQSLLAYIKTCGTVSGDIADALGARRT